MLPRGAGERLPWVFRIDTNVGYRKYFTEDLSIDVTADIFNVVNFQQVVAIDQAYTYSDVVPIEGGSFEDLEALQDHLQAYVAGMLHPPHADGGTDAGTPAGE